MVSRRPAATFWRVGWLLAAFCASLQLELCLAAKVARTSGPHGVGPYNIPAPKYIKGRKCALGPYTEEWDKQLGGFNDSKLNPSLAPVTELRFQKGCIQTVLGKTLSPPHGLCLTSSPFDGIYKLKPQEVVNKIEFWVDQGFGFVGNFTLFTNTSRAILVNWTLEATGSEELVQATAPEDRTWNGQPIAGDWYLAYISTEVWGYCRPKDPKDEVVRELPGYWSSPVFYFTWAADVATTPPVAPPVPAPPVPSPPPSPSPLPGPLDDKKKKKDVNVAAIGGAVGGAGFLAILAALGCLWSRHGKGLASLGLFTKRGGGGPAGAATAGGGGAAGAGAAGGAAVGAGAGGLAKDVEAGPAAAAVPWPGGPGPAAGAVPGLGPGPGPAPAAAVMPAAAAVAANGAAAGMAVPVAGTDTPRDLPPSQPMVHRTTIYPTHAAAAAHPTHSVESYHATQPSAYSYSYPGSPPSTLPPSSPFHTQTNPLLDTSTTLSPRPGTASSLPPSASAPGSEQAFLGAGPHAMSTSTTTTTSVTSSSGGPPSTVIKGSHRPAAMVAPGGGMPMQGAMLHGGGGGGGAMAVGPMAAVGAAGIAVMGTVVLAKEILDAGDRVVANHARCLRLTSRIHSILPLLNGLRTHLEREAQAKGLESTANLQHLVDNMNAVFGDVRNCINRWCGSKETAARRGVLVQVLRNLMVSKKYEDEFLDLNERLSVCYQDLTLALNIKRTVGDNDPGRLKKQHEEDVEADLKGMAEELSTEEGEQAWNSLPSEEKVTVREAFINYGLNFNSLMTQVRKNDVGQRVKDLVIPWSDIQIGTQIGSGGYGTVYRGIWQDTEVAVKKLQLTVVTERAKRELSHEAYVMSLLRHPNVATSYGIVLEAPHCALVMKFYQRGTLLELLHDDTHPLTLRRKLQLAMDVAKGMAYLHNRPTDPVIHGDLKPSNLLIDDDGKVVITDFGLSRVSTLTLTTRPSSSGMSVTYTAPEILADPTCKRTPAADVYAYGLVLFEIFTRGLPFESAADVMAVVQYVLGGGRPKVAGPDFEEQRVPQQVVQLMQDCWSQVPQARPTFTEISEKLKAVDC